MTLGKTALEKKLLIEVRVLQKTVELLKKWQVKLCNELPMTVRMQIQKEIDNE